MAVSPYPDETDRLVKPVTRNTTKPADRVPLTVKLVYGAGAFVNNLLAGTIGAMMIVLNLGLGMNPALVGLLASIPRLMDAITDPVMGYISDNTRTRWGRRRPYIFAGAIVAGLSFIALWQLPEGKSEGFYFWYFLAGSLVFYLGYTLFATPWVALGYELTPDYHERTRLMGVQNFIGQLAYFVPPWLLLAMNYTPVFDTIVDGAAGVSVVIGVFVMAVGVLPAIFIRERLSAHQTCGATGGDGSTTGQDNSSNPNRQGTSRASNFRGIANAIGGFLTGFAIALRSLPFLKLCAATFLIFNGFILVSAFQIYVLIYYLYEGNQELGGRLAGIVGTVSTLSAFVVIVFITWLSTKIGKRRALIFSTAVSAVGYGMKWFLYNPDAPYMIIMSAPLIAFAFGGLFTLMPSMMADVVDYDELNTGERREGMYGSIYWWVVKLGVAVALAGGGVLLNATGFDVALGGGQTDRAMYLLRLFDAFIPVIASLIAIWLIAGFSLTEARAGAIRDELEARRGGVPLAQS